MSEGPDVIWANQKFEPRVVNLANDNLGNWAISFPRVVIWANVGNT